MADDALEKIIINGQEYSPEDASSLIELGNKYRETEKNLNTSLDTLMPKYTQATQRAARAEQLEKDLAERDRLLSEYKAKETKTAIPEDKQQALKSARELGLADQEYLNEQGYIKKSDLDDYWNTKQNQQQLVDNVLKQARQLETELDGSDGRVPFNQKAVLAYASAYNISDLKSAYDEMYEGANKKWQDEQIARQQRPGLTTIGPGGKKIPVEKKIESGDDFKNAWDEMFGN